MGQIGDKIFKEDLDKSNRRITKFNDILITFGFVIIRAEDFGLISYELKTGKNYLRLINKQIIGYDGMLVDLTDGGRKIADIEIKTVKGTTLTTIYKENAIERDKYKLQLLLCCDDNDNTIKACIGYLNKSVIIIGPCENQYLIERSSQKIYNVKFNEKNIIYDADMEMQKTLFDEFIKIPLCKKIIQIVEEEGI